MMPRAIPAERDLPKLCYVLPMVDPAAATHHLHLLELIERVAEEIDVYLIAAAEAGTPAPRGVTHFDRIRAGSFPRRLAAQCRAISRARAMGYRTVYVHYQIYPALFAIAASKAGPGRVLFWSCVEKNAHLIRRAPGLRERLVRNLLVDRPMRAVVRGADTLVTCSEVKAGHYAEDYGRPAESIRVLPLWVNLERFRPEISDAAGARGHLAIPAEARVVLFVHTIGAHRGADWLPDLARTVLARSADTVFVVAGEGPLSGVLRSEVLRLGLEQQFRLLGAVPNSAVPELYGLADVFINPSPTEAFGRVLLEAMACGVPFVSTDGGNGGTLAFTTPAQQEYIVGSTDREAFATKLVELLESPGRRAALKKEGLVHVRDFSLPRAAERFVELVREADAAPVPAQRAGP